MQGTTSTASPKAGASALVIINPVSRQARELDLEEGFSTLKKAGINLIQVKSASAEESCQAVRTHKDTVDLVIVGGGDGTMNSMASVLHENGLCLAVLPLGTANDLARSLGIGDDLELAFQAIVDNQRQWIDLASVNEHFYFNVANLGLGVKVTEALSSEAKKRWGVLSYLKAFLSAIKRKHRFRVTLRCDEREVTLLSMHLAIGNGRFYGGGNIIDEDNYIADGQLTVYSLRPQTLRELLLIAPLLRFGRQAHDEKVFHARATQVQVDTRPSGMEVHADGEAVTHTPAVFRLHRKGLEVIVSQKIPT